MSRRFWLIIGIVILIMSWATSSGLAEVKDTPEGRSAYAFDQAIQNYLKGDSGKAVKFLNESLKFNPANQRARVFLLKILVERGSRLFLAKKFKKAYSYLSQAYHMDPDNDQVCQMFALATKQVKPQKAISKVMLIPKEMKQEMLKQEAEDVTRLQGGTVMTTVKTKQGQEKQVVAQSQGQVVAPIYAEPAPMEAADQGGGGASSALLMQEYAKNVSAMTQLMATFTKSQEKQMAQFMAPLERIQNLYYQSETDRKKFMSRLDSQFKNLLGNVSFQQRMVIYGFIIGLVLLGALTYIFYLIVKRMRSKREEVIMKYQQEMLKMVRDMAGLPGSNTYGMLGAGGAANAGYRLNHGMQPQQQLISGQPMQQPMPGQQPIQSQQPVQPMESNQNYQPGAEYEQVIQTGNYKERSLAAVQLMDVDTEKALDYIKQMITDTDPFQRESMAFALGEKYHPLTLELVIEALKDNEKRVKDASARALRRLEQSLDEAITDEIRNEIKETLSTMSNGKKSRKKPTRS